MTFEEIASDKPATFKQTWAVAYKLTESIEGDYPDFTKNALVRLIQGTIYYYHKETETSLTHAEVQEFLEESKAIPEYYLEHFENYINTTNKEKND